MLASDSGRLRRALTVFLALVCLLALASAVADAAQKDVTQGSKQAAAAGKGISAPFCRRGEALLALGRIPEAEAAFAKEMETGSSVRCARSGLAKIGSERPCAVAKALLRNGERTEANKVYLESLKTKPTKKCAKAGVKSSAQSFPDHVKSVSEDIVIYLGAALLCLVLLALAFLLLVRFLSWIPKLKDWCFVGGIRQVTVTIEKPDDSAVDPKLGAGTAALMRKWIETDGSRSYVKFVSGGDATEETWLSKVSEAGEKGKLAAALIGLFLILLPRRHVKVTGELQPATPSGGPGISVELHRKLASKGTAVLWADQFALPVDPAATAESLRKLVVPAAAWVSHRVTTETKRKALSSKDPMSWALFKVGVQWQRDIEMEKAEQLYRAAIQIDSENYGARTNLGLLCARKGEYERALGLFEEARTILEQKPHDYQLNQDWYRVSYNLAAECLNWAHEEGTGVQERLERAKARCELLGWSIAWVYAQPEDELAVGGAEGRELLKFLRLHLQPSLDVLAAGIQLYQSRLEGAKEDTRAVLEMVAHFASSEEYKTEVEFNLACLYAQIGKRKVAKLHLERAFAGTNLSDRLLFAWRVANDLSLGSIQDCFLGKHPHEAELVVKAAARSGTGSQAQRSWI
jgi:tetratricopeptide (TPR) repeat protein